MRIIKDGNLESTRHSVRFFKKHYKELAGIKYIVLYFAEWEWSLNPELFHQYVIVIGERAQIWMSGLTWGYYGEGPYGLYKVLRMIDPNITYDQVAELDWTGEKKMIVVPIVFENRNGTLNLSNFNESIKSLLYTKDKKLPWQVLNKSLVKEYEKEQ